MTAVLLMVLGRYQPLEIAVTNTSTLEEDNTDSL